jgi:hypothetical protein
MQTTIASHEPAYQQTKQKLYEDVGYETGTGFGKLVITASNFDDIANAFLGLGKCLPLTEFAFTQARFGLVSPKPTIDFRGEGKLVVTPQPVDTCEIGINANGRIYTLAGHVFSLGAPLLPREQMRVRFSAEFLEVVMVASSPPELKAFNANIDPNSNRTLHVLEAFASLNDCCEQGKQLDLQIWARGERALGGKISLNKTAPASIYWGHLALALRKLRGLLAGRENAIKVSLNEVIKSGQRLAVFAAVIDAPSLRLEIQPTPDTPSKIDSLVFYSFVDIGKFLFFSLYEAELVHENVVGERRQFNFGAPRQIDFYPIENPNTQQREQMEKDYLRHLKFREQQGHPAGIGEMLTFSQGNRPQPKAA